MKRRALKGFTLLELMIVVIILGILAAIAVPSFMGQYNYSKTSEVHALLRDIAAKQEAYKAEFGQYLNVSGDLSFANRKPAAAPRRDFGYVAWDPAADPDASGWEQLGFSPQSMVRFGYVVTAGLPTVDGSGSEWVAGLADINDHWWAAAAFGNVDTDDASTVGNCSQYYLSSSQNVMGVVNDEE